MVSLPTLPEFPSLPEVPGLTEFPELPDINVDCNPQKDLCAKLNRQLSDLQNKIDSFSGIFDDKLQAIKDQLDSYKDLIPSNLGDALDALNRESTLALPSLDDCSMDEVKAMMQNCGPSSQAFESAKQMAKDMEKAVEDALKEIFGDFETPSFGITLPSLPPFPPFPEFPQLPSFDLPEFQLPEFPISMKMDGLDKFLGKLKMPELLGQFDSILSCLDSICKDINLDSQITAINTSLGDMAIGDDGKLDVNQLMDSVGVSPSHAANILDTKGVMADISSAATDAAQAGADQINGTVASIKAEAAEPAQGVIAKYKALF